MRNPGKMNFDRSDLTLGLTEGSLIFILDFVFIEIGPSFIERRVWYNGTTKGKTLWREGKEKSLDELRARVR